MLISSPAPYVPSALLEVISTMVDGVVEITSAAVNDNEPSPPASTSVSTASVVAFVALRLMNPPANEPTSLLYVSK